MAGWRQCISIRVVVPGLLSVVALQAQQTMGSQSNTSSPGAELFASNCAGCHGADGRGGEHAPNIATAAEVQHLASPDLIGIVTNGISGAGMPAFSSLGQKKVEDVVAYLRILQGRGNIVKLPGDPSRGEALFFGKAHCSDCHMINGKGGFIGSDLSFYGADAPADQMRAMILDPDKNLPAEKKAITVVTLAGQKITGILKVKDNFSLTIQTMDGSFRFLPNSELAQVDFGSHSLMPANYGSTLNSKEVDDLVSYLLRIGDENARRSPTHSSKSDDDDN
jgi:putative heme-binding domain-containing protein